MLDYDREPTNRSRGLSRCVYAMSVEKPSTVENSQHARLHHVRRELRQLAVYEYQLVAVARPV